MRVNGFAARGGRRGRVSCTVVQMLAVAAFVSLCPSAARGAPDGGRELLVPGGTAVLLRAAGVRVAVEPDRALLVLIRHLHAGRSEPAQIDAVLARAATQPSDAERVPVLLPPDVWQRAVFAREVPAEGLAAAILRDRQASFLYHGLFALDDDTLAFVAANPALIGALHKRLAAPFAAYSEGIRIRGGRLQVPGGVPAEAAWERVLGASPADPVRFVTSLLERDGGRAAQLFEALGRLDPPRLAFALGPSARDLPALVSAAAAFDAYVHLPFASWSDVDTPFLLEHVGVTPEGRLAPPLGRSFWESALSGEPVPAPRGGPGATEEVNAAWLVERFAALQPALRRPRLDAVLFAQRLAARRGAGPDSEWLEAAASFPVWQTLFLTLEQLGAADPLDYRAAARAAAVVTAGHGGAEAARRLAAFQSAVALVARLVRVGTLAPPAGLDLARDLFGRAGADRQHYAGAIADWIEGPLFARLPEPAPGAGAESRLLDALAGPAAADSSPVVEWEGRSYVVDVAGAERQRLEGVREGQGGDTLDDVIALRHGAMPRSGDDTGPQRANQRGGAPHRRPAELDAALADVLVAYVYALVTNPDAPMVPGDGPWRRHDFGLGDGSASTAWRFAELKAGRGARGSLLGLERTLARESLRSTMMGLPPRPPTLTLEDTTGLAESVVAINPTRLTDEGRDHLAAAVRRGRSRLAASSPETLDALLASAGVDGIRRRLARLATGAGPAGVLDFVSLSEVVALGEDATEATRGTLLDGWGAAARLVDGSLGQRMPGRLAWRDRAGRPGSGLMAACVVDLQIRVAEWLSERRLPASLARAVLSLATWDLAMTAQVAGADDWLPVVRAAQAVSSGRLEDYVSALAAGGPLMAGGTGQ